ncbi:organic solute transporter subunit alpha-like [Apostichopus japonicus]|uniref:organic solute transporter subunit alpha-like n=1 Tax=Stichopus japonicus TaxID=307972 RepID=UPI003AB6E7E4
MADDNDTWYTTELALGVGSTLAPEKPKYPFGCDGPVLIKPTTEQLLAALAEERTILILLAFAIGLTVLTVGIFIESLIYVCRKIPSRRKVQLAFVMGIYPVFCTTSLMALLVPNAALLTHFTAQVYFSVALVQFIMLLTGYYGSKDGLLNLLKGQIIPLGSPPLLIFCTCLWPKIPIVPPTYKKFIRAIRFMVIQTAIFKPMMLFIGGMLWSNNNYTPGNFSGSDPWLVMEIMMLFSSMFALNGIIIMFRISKDTMKEFHLVPKFFTVQLTLILTSVQGFTISLIVYFGGIACRPPFIPPMRGLYYDKFLNIFEMFIFNLFATIWFRRLDGNLDEVQKERRLSKYSRLSGSISGPPGGEKPSNMPTLSTSLEGGMDDFDQKVLNNNSRNAFTVEHDDEKKMPYLNHSSISKNGGITPPEDQRSEYEGEGMTSSSPLVRSDSDRETNV